MGPTLAQLEALHWIVQLGSVRAAAEHLHLTQPTVSLRVRALERALDCKLFSREGRRLRPSAAGTELALHAESMLALARRIAGAELARDPLRLRLRLGAPDSFAAVCLPHLLRRLGRRNPDLKVGLTVENSSLLERQLQARKLDLAFISSAAPAPGVRSELLGQQELAWVAGPRPGLPRRTLEPGDLARHQVFTNPEPSRLIVLVRDWFSRGGVHAPRISTCNSLSVVARLTSAGAGVSLLPTAVIRSELHSGALQRLATRPPVEPQRLYAAYHADAAGGTIDALLALAQDVVARTRFVQR
jgi:DNA-binding transcriptional LysR family regulator